MEINFDAGHTEQVLSPWVTLVTRGVRFPDDPRIHEFHSLKLADYSTVLAVTTDGRIPMVRQYRPPQRRFTLELPSGFVDPKEEPLAAAARELREETGLQAKGMEALGCLLPDSGRLENRIWGFFTAGVNPERAAEWQAESGVESLLLTRRELKDLMLNGQFDHALHVAFVGLALARGLFSFGATAA